MFRKHRASPTDSYRYRKTYILLTLIVLLVGIVWFSADGLRVERIYTFGLYPVISGILRIIFGWIPFSIGDIIYVVLTIFLIVRLVKFIRDLFRHRFSWRLFWKNGLSWLNTLLAIALLFYIIWGINYQRLGIGYQLQLQAQTFDTGDLHHLEQAVLEKVNLAKSALIRNGQPYPSKQEVFKRSVHSYKQAAKEFPFLQYRHASIKSSMIGRLGNYLGFTGYYNPFTAEAQVNTTVPDFLIPYITTHEMAHQIGYAKEAEANFVGYLACAQSTDPLFHYSVYLDLFMYANRQLTYIDTTTAKRDFDRLLPEVKEDIEVWRKFNRSHSTFLQPVTDWVYGSYLKLNSQPEGMRSYGEVTGLLMAYYKKYGKI